MTDAGPIPGAVLARLPLALAALEGATLVADSLFPPGATVTVGSNSRNDLIIPVRFELTSYTLLTQGSRLHLVPPFHVQAMAWVGDEARELKGFVRDLKRRWPDLPRTVELASERFIIRYATGLALIGRFVPPEPPAAG